MVGKKGESVFSPVNGNSTCLTRWWRDLTDHAGTLNKHWILSRVSHPYAQAQISKPASPQLGVHRRDPDDHKNRPKTTRKQNLQVKAGVAAWAPPPEGERVAYVGSHLPCHVSKPVPQMEGFAVRMAASFVVVRNAERLSRFSSTR
ncbi:hypothetical protein mRhiFer1_008734 [Rhinolophus ferrumequinum]|uniref:Uncharacterized protein n=1 Tax=Rhinolophus ferrumequinum TaxID=59479 RepID=A0A7J7TRH0_RHIFE|nr:hypothetical protein mRhiFer1_008734 [Rhinolophus ferrumequinum]